MHNRKDLGMQNWLSQNGRLVWNGRLVTKRCAVAAAPRSAFCQP